MDWIRAWLVLLELKTWWYAAGYSGHELVLPVTRICMSYIHYDFVYDQNDLGLFKAKPKWRPLRATLKNAEKQLTWQPTVTGETA